MNKDVVVATYEERECIVDFSYEEIERFDGYLPHGFISMDHWIDGRKIARNRDSIGKLMRVLKLVTRHDFVGMARCLSLTDTFWVKREDEDIA